MPGPCLYGAAVYRRAGVPAGHVRFGRCTCQGNTGSEIYVIQPGVHGYLFGVLVYFSVCQTGRRGISHFHIPAGRHLCHTALYFLFRVRAYGDTAFPAGSRCPDCCPVFDPAEKVGNQVPVEQLHGSGGREAHEVVVGTIVTEEEFQRASEAVQKNCKGGGRKRQILCYRGF